MASTRNGCKKRRPIDPEETGAVDTASYYVEQPNAKRARTIDDALGSLSLRSPDPPGNSFCWQRNGDVGISDVGGEEERSATAAESVRGTGSVEPVGKDAAPTNATSELTSTSLRQQYQCQREPMPLKSTSEKDTETAMDDSDHESEDDSHESDSSVSESSIRNAMYQLVFGRRNPPPLSNAANGGGGGDGGGCGRYNAVDSKIEDMIRRSRLEAVIKMRKKGKKDDTSATGMDIGGESTEIRDGDKEWNPGHR